MSGIISSRLKARMKSWTESLVGDENVARLKDTRTSAEYGVDAFGFDLDYALSTVGPILWLARHYWRTQVYGIEKVPPGRVLLIANHSGQLPVDGAMIGAAMLTRANPPRAIRSMVEKWAPTLPYVSTFFARVGQVVGTPENCLRLLEQDQAILVFPEGIRGISKLYSERYQLQEFGLGFMRLALETRTPIVPIGVVGGEEQAPAIANLKPLAKLLAMPAFPVTPWGLPVPLPSQYHLHFGEPITFTGRPDDDDAELEKKVNVVKSAVSQLLEKGLEERKGVFF